MTHDRIVMTSPFLLTPPHKDAKTVLLDVGDRRIDFQRLADSLAALRTQIVAPEAENRGHNRLWKALISDPIPPHKDAKTALLDVGDRRIDFQGLADRLAALSTQSVVREAGKMRP